MSKKQKIIAIVVASLAVIFAALAIVLIVTDNKSENGQKDDDTQAVVCPIEDGVVTYAGETGKTALEILSSLCDVTVQETHPETIVSIDGISATETGDYWALFVNGDYILSNTASYETKNGDTLKWKIEHFEN